MKRIIYTKYIRDDESCEYFIDVSDDEALKFEKGQTCIKWLIEENEAIPIEGTDCGGEIEIIHELIEIEEV